jgi:hypothetical protein
MTNYINAERYLSGDVKLKMVLSGDPTKYADVKRYDEIPMHTQGELDAVATEAEIFTTAEQVEIKRRKDLAALDPGLIRVVEDLIDVGIAKGLYQLADFDQNVQDKYNARKALRPA